MWDDIFNILIRQIIIYRKGEYHDHHVGNDGLFWCMLFFKNLNKMRLRYIIYDVNGKAICRDKIETCWGQLK